MNFAYPEGVRALLTPRSIQTALSWLQFGLGRLTRFALAMLFLPVANAADVAWVSSSGVIYEVDIGLHRVRALPVPRTVVKHAVESPSKHWLITSDGLSRFDSSTGEDRFFTFDSLNIDGADFIAVRPTRSEAWIAKGYVVKAVQYDGAVSSSQQFNSRILALTMDWDGNAWAVTTDVIVRFGFDAHIAEMWKLKEPIREVDEFLVDPYRGVAWIKYGTELTHLALSDLGIASRSIPVAANSSFSLDAQNGSMKVVDSRLESTLSHSGQILSTRRIGLTFDRKQMLAFLPGGPTYPDVMFFREGVSIGFGNRSREMVFAFEAQSAAFVPLQINPTLRTIQPPTGSKLGPPYPSIVARLAENCLAEDCPLPDGYWNNHRVVASLNEVESSESPSIDAITGQIGFANLGTPIAGLNVLTLRLVDKDGSSITTSTTEFEVSELDAQEQSKRKALPAVVLTSPASGAIFTAPATIGMTATASDSDGTVSKVEFLRGSTLLGTDTSTPYAYSWTNVVAGTYTLAARATDNSGGVTTSTNVTVIVNAPPVISISAPVANATFPAGTTISITATATDSDGTIAKVDFYAGATLIGTKTTSPYTFAWPSVPAGTFSLTAKATDNRNAVTTSATISIVVNALPTVTLTSPAVGTVFTAPATIAMAASATDSDGNVAKVEFLRGGVLLGTDTSAPFTYSWANVAAGSYTLAARAFDNRGAVVTSATVAVIVNAAPTTSITAPAVNAVFPAGSNVLITANASDSDGTIAKVEFYAGTTLLGISTTAPYSHTWMSVPAATYSLTVKAIDNRGAVTTSAARSITVNALPSVVLTLPVEGALLAAPATVVLQATASDADGSISKVEFFSGSTKLGTDTSIPYAFTWYNVGVGTYVLTAKATDNRTAVSTSTPVNLTVVAAPTISLVSPIYQAVYNAPGNIFISANASTPTGTITKVEFFSGSTVLATDTQAPYQFAWQNVPAGNYNLSAKATTSLGVTATTGIVSVSVAPQIPLVLTVNATTGQVQGNSATVSGTVQAPINSSVLVNGVPALLGDDGVYFADNVPLTGGNNSISVVVTTMDGRTATQSTALAATGVPTAFTLSANPNSGLAPLYTALRIGRSTSLGISSVEFDHFGSGDFVAMGVVDRIETSFAYPGTYRPQVRIVDTLGGMHELITTIVVRDAAMQDQTFQGIWTAMNNALTVGNLTTANRYLTSDAQAKFSQVFSVLAGDFPAIVASYGQFWPRRIGSGYAEYAISRLVNGSYHLFFVNFLLGSDGVWRIGEM